MGGNKDNIDKTQIQPFQKDENACCVPAIIIGEDEEYISEDLNKLFNPTPEEREVCEKVIDNATTLLLDVANDNYRYNITNKSDEWDPEHFFVATLADGRRIGILFEDKDDSGIVKIHYIEIFNNKKDEKLILSTGGYCAYSNNLRERDGSFTFGPGDLDFSNAIEKIFGDTLREKYGSDIKIEANI